MAVVTWRKDFTLTSALGQLTIPFQMLDATRCSAGTELRITDDVVPGSDGSIFHPRFKKGYQMTIGISLYDVGVVMLGSTLQAFYDSLMTHLDNLIDNDGTISWPVDGGGNARMLNDIRTLQMPAVSGVLPREIVFAVESPFPYAWDAPETDTALTPGSVSTIQRPGSAKAFWPVFEVYGPATKWSLKNNTTGLLVSFDGSGSLPGATVLQSGHHAEVDMFRKTVTLDGNVSFLEEGVNWASSNFFPLVPSTNAILASGCASALMKWQAAWS